MRVLEPAPLLAEDGTQVHSSVLHKSVGCVYIQTAARLNTYNSQHADKNQLCWCGRLRVLIQG